MSAEATRAAAAREARLADEEAAARLARSALAADALALEERLRSAAARAVRRQPAAARPCERWACAGAGRGSTPGLEL